ncbi:uncharacterized protein LOC111408271 [Olea europaea var. sylvestris]|uniref:uncharacterized protein LOC111408271 n=1 Tax=Olea europaea var. sylvestris TaxID=158386 RepID=UPI000C1D5AA9|nr:uncharacterized protein LOC111408271 [Olea europaea var. sylvestris]
MIQEDGIHSLAIACRLLRFIVPFVIPLCNGLAVFRTFAGQIWIFFADQSQFLCDSILEEVAEEPGILGPLRDNCSSKDNAFTSINIEEKNSEEVAKDVNSTVTRSQVRAPKKIVSFNESVEEILPNSSRRIKTPGSSCTLQCQKEEAKPLKSILKVGSKIFQKEIIICN